MQAEVVAEVNLKYKLGVDEGAGRECLLSIGVSAELARLCGK